MDDIDGTLRYEKQIAELRRTVDELVRALEPFAANAEKFRGAPDADRIDWYGKTSITIGDLYRAAVAVKKARGG